MTDVRNNRSLRRTIALLSATAVIAAGGTIAAPSSAPAAAAVPTPTSTTSVVTVKTGGDRVGPTGVGPLAGVRLGLYSTATATSPVNNSWALCSSDSGGDCSFTVPNTQSGGANYQARFFVRQVAAPTGWYTNSTLRTQTSNTALQVPTDYVFQTPSLIGGTTYKSGTSPFMYDVATRNVTATASGGVWQSSRNNPDLSGCGLSVALVLDVSGSVGADLPNLQNAGRTLVNGLVGTPSSVSLYTFSSNAPADATGNQNRPLTAVSTQVGADTVNGWIGGTTSSGGTNWDRGLAQVAESSNTYDVTVMLTDGNPTFYGFGPSTWYPNTEYPQGPGNATRLREIENGVFSANALKAKGTRVIAIGVGAGVSGSPQNLIAISGPTANSDYYQATDYTAAGAALRALALSKCLGSVSVVSQLIPAGGTAADAAPQSGWTFTATAAAGASVTPGTATTDQTGGVNFAVTPVSGATATALRITDQPRTGTSVVQQNGANASCRNLSTGSPVTVTNQGANGFSVDALTTTPVGCTVLHQASSAPGLAGQSIGGRVGDSLTVTPSVTGGAAPLAWSIASGSLPSGLSLDPATGAITGTPTAAGSSSAVLRVADALGRQATATFSFQITTPTTVNLDLPGSVTAGTPITVRAAVTPAGTGTVRFTAVATTGPSRGQTQDWGTATVAADGTASVTYTPTTLGSFTITAAYAGDALREASSSRPGSLIVAAGVGSLTVAEFRQSGPGGAADAYVVLTNTTTFPIALDGFRVSAGDGTTVPLVAAAGSVAPGASYLLAARGYSLGATARPDTTVDSLGSGGLQIVAPDPTSTVTDAVGPAVGPHTGPGLPSLVGTPSQEYAWVRLRAGAGVLQNTADNAADFALVSATGGTVGGVQSMTGAPAPTGLTDPTPSELAPSSLLDDTATASTSPNRVISQTSAGTGTLVVSRLITNRTDSPITSMRLRLTSISEVNGVPRVGVTRPAALTVAAPASPTSTIVVNGAPTTVYNLTPRSPVPTTGGLNTTVEVPLPGGRLEPGQSIPVSLTFTVRSRGTFWFTYATEISGS